MLNTRQQFGYRGEALAIQYLEQNGYQIIHQNYRTKLGEIDIIAKDGDTLVFIEVKARQSYTYGSPKEAITRQKQKKLSMLALHYLKLTKQSRVKARFDVVAIQTSPHHTGHESKKVEIVKNAFSLAYG